MVRVVADIPDSLPRAIVDPVHTQEALTALLADVVSRQSAGGEVSIRAHDTGSGRVILTVKPNSPSDRSPLDVRLAQRILEREGGASLDTDGVRRIELRGERV
jgi:hypothetical protein